MVREELQRASELVADAAEDVEGEARDRLDGFVDQLDTLATREQGPDHGRLDRILHALRDIEEDASDEAGELLERARDKITEYRKTIEGV